MTTNDPTPEQPTPGSGQVPTPPPPPAAPTPPPPPAPPAGANLATPTEAGFPPAQQSDETMWSVLAHLSIFVLGLIGPLLIMLIGGAQRPFARAHAVEALNFHITLFGAGIAGFFLAIILGFIFWPLALLIYLALMAMYIGAIVLAIMAAIKAGAGEGYRYPINVRLVS